MWRLFFFGAVVVSPPCAGRWLFSYWIIELTRTALCLPGERGGDNAVVSVSSTSLPPLLRAFCSPVQDVGSRDVRWVAEICWHRLCHHDPGLFLNFGSSRARHTVLGCFYTCINRQRARSVGKTGKKGMLSQVYVLGGGGGEGPLVSDTRRR